MQKALEKYWPVFVVPTFLAFCIGFIWPFIQGVYLSFCRFRNLQHVEFVGFDNYIKAFTIDPNPLLSSFKFTTIFAIVSIILINVGGFAIALVLTKGIRGTNAFRTIFFMPNLIGGIVLGYIWNVLIGGVLSIIGAKAIELNPTAGFWGLVVLMCWQQMGYMMIIYVAGLQSVPESLIEAAKIDGATKLRTLFQVKIPMVMPSITICVFLTLTNSYKLFDQNLALTRGEPGGQTSMMALNIYKTFYERSGLLFKGLGQAKAVIFCLIVVILSFIQLYTTRSKEVQQ